MGFQTSVRIYGVAYSRNAIVTDHAHIIFGVNADHTTFSASNASDLHRVDIENTSPRWYRWLVRIASFGISEAVDAIIDKVVGDRVFSASTNVLSEKLRTGAEKISTVAQKIPGLEDLTAGGHLLFERVAFVDGGAAFMGIRATGSAKQRSDTSPRMPIAAE